MGHLFPVLAMAAAAATANCDPDIAARIQIAFGNTIVSTYPDGRQAHLWLHPDGTYTSHGRHDDRTNGFWKIKGERICFRQARPRTFPISYCTPIPAGGMGTSWQARAVTGEMLSIRLVYGRPERSA